jgi:hypothetical protein
LIEIAGYTAVMEAVKAGVKDLCFAPNLKDAGIIMSFEKTALSQTLANGMHSGGAKRYLPPRRTGTSR